MVATAPQKPQEGQKIALPPELYNLLKNPGIKATFARLRREYPTNPEYAVNYLRETLKAALRPDNGRVVLTCRAALPDHATIVLGYVTEEWQTTADLIEQMADVLSESGVREGLRKLRDDVRFQTIESRKCPDRNSGYRSMQQWRLKPEGRMS